jgi:acyl carrier protein
MSAITPDNLKDAVVRALTSIAPEINPAMIQPGVSFREQLDLDSVDFLNFVLALHDALDVDIPEADYPKLTSLDSAVAYLAAASRSS